ncbi:sulfotransferase family protein [Alteromonas stellipolaris]|uniref:sulfotransferase family protein n=1 Tax=Alteromonas stellipolaris TaxID=233316 RepID=UPI0021191676|nr:sulfotransferase family protein [Alteromonas stellipolaris]MCQ8847219.1 sulfotransferase family protein [Alteromonas stellipolaris]
MSFLDRLSYLAGNSGLLISRPQRIYMLSHMRSRSSLLSHILGSNPEISGYSELSIKYRDRFSCLDQKIKLHQDGLVVDSSVKLFDKILHNSFDFKSTSPLNSNGVDVLIMLRPPESTIKSIVTMGEKNGNTKYADVNWASKYYVSRVEKLCTIANELERFFFVKSDDIVENSEVTLSKLSNFLRLQNPLTVEYGSFNLTGKKKSGDTSENIKAGKIVKTKANDNIIISNAKLSELEEFYNNSIENLKSLSADNI